MLGCLGAGLHALACACARRRFGFPRGIAFAAAGVAIRDEAARDAECACVGEVCATLRTAEASYGLHLILIQ